MLQGGRSVGGADQWTQVACCPSRCKTTGESAVGFATWPMMHTIVGKPVCFGKTMKPEFGHYAHSVVENCKVMAAVLPEAGTGQVSCGSEIHFLLVDVTPLGINGRQAQQAQDSVGIIANNNAIPFDQRPPRVARGLRLGTPAITSRGMGTEEAARVTSMVARVLGNIDDGEMRREVADEVRELTDGFPAPGIDE